MKSTTDFRDSTVSNLDVVERKLGERAISRSLLRIAAPSTLFSAHTVFDERTQNRRVGTRHRLDSRDSFILDNTFEKFVQDLWNRVDVDKSGTLDPEEVKAVFVSFSVL
eukprot:SAG11_NODE_7665_length_1113_cov_1.008876_1_plen_109_part_00